MSDQGGDWLDQRLAATEYIPDEGFTARITESLPKRRARFFTTRTVILLASTLVALALAGLQAVPLVRNADRLSVQMPVANWMGQSMVLLQHLLQNPTVIVGASLAAMVLAFASIPFLRRWA